jgi:hypothetical protein
MSEPTYGCLVCGFDGLTEPPLTERGSGSYEICPACGFQFGVSDDDRGITYDEWRREWVADGMPWRSAGIEPSPEGWNPRAQIERLENE